MSIDSQDDAPRVNDAFAAEVPAADSAVEKIKHASDGLRGQIAAGLADPHTAAVREDDANLVKFHAFISKTTATCAPRAKSENWSPRIRS